MIVLSKYKLTLFSPYFFYPYKTMPQIVSKIYYNESIKIFSNNSKGGFWIESTPLTFIQICEKDSRYVVKDGELYFLDKKVSNTKSQIDRSHAIIDGSICLIGKCPEEFVLPLLYPLYVVDECQDDKKVTMTLIDNVKLMFYRQGEHIIADCGPNGIYNFKNPTEVQKLRNQWGKLRAIHILCKGNEDIRQITSWFIEDEKCYIYWDGTLYASNPPQVDFIIPDKYYNKIVEKFNKEGYCVYLPPDKLMGIDPSELI